MATVIIYHHDERELAEDFCRPLQSDGYEFKFAPLGTAVGSPERKGVVKSALAEADAFLFFVTAKSVLDEMVSWRVKPLYRANRKLNG